MKPITEILEINFPLEYDSEVWAMSVTKYRQLEGAIWEYGRCYGVDVVHRMENGKSEIEINNGSKSRALIENLPLWFLFANPEFDLVHEIRKLTEVSS